MSNELLEMVRDSMWEEMKRPNLNPSLTVCARFLWALDKCKTSICCEKKKDLNVALDNSLLLNLSLWSQYWPGKPVLCRKLCFLTCMYLALRFDERPLPGAHVRRGLFRICPALVFPPSLRGMPAVCVRRLRWKPEQLLLQTRVPELVCKVEGR